MTLESSWTNAIVHKQAAGECMGGAQQGLDRPLRAKTAQSLHVVLLLPLLTAEIRSQSFGPPPTDRKRRLQQASTVNHITQLDATQWMQIPGPLCLL